MPTDSKARKRVHEEALERFKAAADADRDDRALRLDDLKFSAGNSDNGYQWPDAVRQSRKAASGGERPCLTINRINQHIRQVTNEMRRNRPSIRVRPVNDKGDPKVAEVISGIVRHTENNRNELYSGASVAITTATEAQVTSGVGYFAIATDYCDDEGFEQDIFWRRIRNPFAIYDDPEIQTPDGRDRRYLFETTMMDETEFTRTYPKAEPLDWSADGGELSLGWYDMGAKRVRVAKYWAVETTYRERKNGNKTRKVAERKVCIYTLNGAEVIEEEEYPGKYIPFVRVVGNEWDIDGKVERSGLTRNSKDAQRQYNYWASAEVEMLALAPRAPFIAPIESIDEFSDIWESANRVNHSYLPYRAVTEDGKLLPPPARAQPPLPPAGFIHAKQGAADDIKSTTGQYDASLGNRSNEQSGRAIIARQSEGDMATMHYQDNLGFAMEYAGSIILDLIPRVYDTARVLRIIGEDDSEEYARIDPTLEVAVKKVAGESVYNLSIGRYDVVVNSGPNFKTKREESLNFLTQINQSAPQIGAAAADLLVKMADVPYGDEIAKRVKALLPPPVLEMLQRDEEEGGDQSQQMAAAVQQLKKALGEAMGRLQAAEQGVQERDSELAKLQTTVDTKAMTASEDRAKAEADAEAARIKAETEMIKADSAREIAAAEVRKAELAVSTAELAFRSQVLAARQLSVETESAEIEGDSVPTIETPVSAAIQRQSEMIAQLITAMVEAQNAPKPPRTLSLRGPSGNTYDVAIN